MAEGELNQEKGEDPDAVLMARFAAGDRVSFDVLFKKHFRPVFSFCHRFLGNPQEAEDAAQDVFLQAYEAGSRYRPEARFTTWLYTIAKNVCLNRVRKAGREISDPPDENEPSEESTYRQPDKIVEEKEIAEAVRRAVLSLPDSLRIPLILAKYHGLSGDQIGEILGTSEGAVKVRVHRARKILAGMLSGFRPPSGEG